jgi:hypothetical protein
MLSTDKYFHQGIIDLNLNNDSNVALLDYILDFITRKDRKFFQLRVKEGHTVNVHTRDDHFIKIGVNPSRGRYMLECLSGLPRIISSDQDFIED